MRVPALAMALVLAPGAFEVSALRHALAQTSLDGLGREATSQPVALVADRVRFDEALGTLTAEGNVEVFQGNRVLTASRIVYDSRTDRIVASGPLTLRDDSGVVLLADTAELDAQLVDGIIEGARAVITGPDGGGATLAAVEARRIDGRFNVLSRAVYSPCEVCPEWPRPLWQIRARHIVHDQERRVVFYEGAVFDVLGVPVAFLPFFSHPDPTVQRQTGLLPPTFSGSGTYGFGVQLPYFVAIDESRDLTLTAFLTTNDGPIGIAEYRQAFDRGRMGLLGSGGILSTGDGGSSERRWHLFGDGRFAVDDLGVGNAAEAGFALQLASDNAYLARYGFSDADRLESFAFVQNYGDTGFYRLRATTFESLRDFEPDGDRLSVLPEFETRTVMPLDDVLGGSAGLGRVGLEASTVFLTRPSGRDVARFSAGADWEATRILDAGLLVRGFAETRIDTFFTANDADFSNEAAVRVYPQVGLDARYPLIGTWGRSNHLIEPGVMVVVAPNSLDAGAIPNEDSVTVEFDETNIFSTNRFPGFDRVETGTRLNVGVRYARVADDPFILDGSIGRVFRLTEEGAFSPGSGLTDQRSDYVGSLTFGYAPLFTIVNRVRFDDNFDFGRAEITGGLSLNRANFTASYVYLAADPALNAPRDRAEFNAAATVDLTRNWQVSGRLRRDLQEAETVLLAARVGYRTECAAVDFGIRRDFPDRRGDDAETSFSIRVQLFGVADGTRRAGRCSMAALR